MIHKEINMKVNLEALIKKGKILITLNYSSSDG